MQVIGGIRVAPDGVAMQHDQQQQVHQSRQNAHHIHPRADGQADDRRKPKHRGGSEPADRVAVFEDDARAEKADPADDLGGQTRRIGGSGTVQDPSQIREAVFGHDHAQGRSAADHDVRAYARLLEAFAPLNADEHAEDTGHGQPAAAIQQGAGRNLKRRKKSGLHKLLPPSGRSQAEPAAPRLNIWFSLSISSRRMGKT